MPVIEYIIDDVNEDYLSWIPSDYHDDQLYGIRVLYDADQIGGAVFHLSEDLTRAHLLYIYIYISPLFRRQGEGSSLLSRSMLALYQIGVREIFAKITEEDQDSDGFDAFLLRNEFQLISKNIILSLSKDSLRKNFSDSQGEEHRMHAIPEIRKNSTMSQDEKKRKSAIPETLRLQQISENQYLCLGKEDSSLQIMYTEEGTIRIGHETGKKEFRNALIGDVLFWLSYLPSIQGSIELYTNSGKRMYEYMQYIKDPDRLYPEKIYQVILE